MQFPDGDSFADATFQDLALTGADLGGRELVKCTIRNAKLDETRWSKTRLEDCIFDNCDLTRANFASLALRDVVFKNCKLMGIDFSVTAKLPMMSFENCNMRYVSFVGVAMKKASLRDCALHEANFIDVDLTGATLVDCNFTGATFDRCTLANAKFTHAAGLFVDPAKNKVKGMHVPLEAAVLLAASFGFRVSGYELDE
ncbi:MAG TPA: pentapeptide repeat-containing protein [Kofleriaceae bacterium]